MFEVDDQRAATTRVQQRQIHRPILRLPHPDGFATSRQRCSTRARCFSASVIEVNLATAAPVPLYARSGSDRAQLNFQTGGPILLESRRAQRTWLLQQNAPHRGLRCRASCCLALDPPTCRVDRNAKGPPSARDEALSQVLVVPPWFAASSHRRPHRARPMTAMP